MKTNITKTIATSLQLGVLLTAVMSVTQPAKAQTFFGGGSTSNSASNASSVAMGFECLHVNTTGASNNAFGFRSLWKNTTGSNNCGFGIYSLYANTVGNYNCGIGAYALEYNGTGNSNTAIGYGALFSNQTGSNNTALGFNAGLQILGANNIAIGNTGTSTDNGIIRIGTPNTHTRAFVAGINGVTITNGVGVYINASGQLGTVTSSRRFKYDIKDMANVSERLLHLRPVTFRYKEASGDGQHPIQYGFIAEEVAKVFPELVQCDKQGKPFTVYYHLIAPLLLNEFQKEHKQLTQLQVSHKAEVVSLKQKSEAQGVEIARLKSLLQQQNQIVATLKQAQAEQGKMLSQITVALQNRALPSHNVSLLMVQH